MRSAITPIPIPTWPTRRPPAVRLELNATQRLFQALTGRSLRLFRSPYLSDANPSDADEIEPIKQAQALGYIEVDLQSRHPGLGAADGAPDDGDMVYRALNNPNPDLRGNIILMHDSGGDRSKTAGAAAAADRFPARQGLSVRAAVGAGGQDPRRGDAAPAADHVALCRPGGVPHHQLCRAVPLLLLPGRHRAGRGAAVRAGGAGAVEAGQGAGRAAAAGRTAASGDGADPRLQ